MVPQTVLKCNGCTACCKRDTIYLGPNDDPRAYKWHEENGYAVLDRKENGECIYLVETGCSIHGSAPEICRRFDCRELVKMTPPEMRIIRIQQNPTLAEVYAAGLQRLEDK